jgi:ribosome biogenesis GTPase A
MAKQTEERMEDLRKKLADLEAEKERLTVLLSQETLAREDAERRIRLLTRTPDETERSQETERSAAERFDENLNARLKDALEKFSPAADFFPTRAAQLESLLRAVDVKMELEVGVVGITSSGKSTFVNAVMGERLLPEETRATTNLTIRCRKGAERFVTVVSRNGEKTRVAGANLTAAWMESQSSERLNPNNEKGVALLEWSSPRALLPEGLVLIDTPGLDAHDFPEHSELVLRRLLPTLDIVLYVTSIRSRLKTADLDALSAVLEQSQRIVFLLSQIDLERDDTEGGRVILSRRRKLLSSVQDLREDIEAHGAFARGDASNSVGPAIFPVSSRLALAHFNDRNSAGWRASKPI